MPALDKAIVENWNVSFHRDLHALRAFGHIPGGSRNTWSVGRLLAGFFHYYAFEFDFDNYVVCEHEQMGPKQSGVVTH